MRRLLLVACGLSLLSGCGDKEDSGPTADPADDTGDTQTPTDDSGDTDTKTDDTGDTDTKEPDYDGDGSPDDEDCSDTNPDIYPGAEEIPYDGIDQDCDGYDITDWDDDGYDAEQAGGDDCNDEDPAIHPDADDVIGNNTDDDCDGEVDEGVEEIPEDYPLTLSGSGAATSRFIAMNAKGNPVIGGNFTGEIDFHPYEGHDEYTAAADGDIFLSQIASNGEYMWTWVGSSDESITLHDVTADESGNLLLAGEFSGTADFDHGPGTYNLTATGGTDAFIARVSDTGSILWAVAFGGKEDDAAFAVADGGAARVVATGSFSDTVTFITKDGAVTAAGLTDAFLVQLDASGNATWAATFGGKKATAAGLALSSDSKNNITVAGRYDGAVALEEKTTTDSGSGAFILQRAIGSEEVWAQHIPGDITVSALITGADDGHYLGGTLSNSADLDASDGEEIFTASGTDGFICSLDSGGAFQSATLYGSKADDTIDDLALDPSGRLYAAGTFSGTISIDGSSETADGGQDVFAMRLDTSGTLDWLMRIGNSTDDGVAGIDTDKDSRGWLAGTFTDELDLDPTEGVDDRDAPDGESGVWAVRVSSGGP